MPPEVRSADEVASRVLCLAAVITRAQAEFLIDSHEAEPGFSSFPGGKPEEVPRIIQRWVDEEKLGPHFSPKERIMMARPTGEFTHRDRLDGWWRREALMVLEWSLGIIEPMPPADTRVPMEDVLESAWLLRNTSSFGQSAKLRSAEEISDQREIAEFWLWRTRRTHRQRLSGEDFAKNEKSTEALRASADPAAATAEARGLFKRIDGDFPAFGKAFRDLTGDEYNLITSISMERLHGLNWLCVIDGLEWDDVELNT
jgi:hypothetical protein